MVLEGYEFKGLPSALICSYSCAKSAWSCETFRSDYVRIIKKTLDGNTESSFIPVYEIEPALIFLEKELEKFTTGRFFEKKVAFEAPQFSRGKKLIDFSLEFIDFSIKKSDLKRSYANVFSSSDSTFAAFCSSILFKYSKTPNEEFDKQISKLRNQEEEGTTNILKYYEIFLLVMQPSIPNSNMVNGALYAALEIVSTGKYIFAGQFISRLFTLIRVKEDKFFGFREKYQYVYNRYFVTETPIETVRNLSRNIRLKLSQNQDKAAIEKGNKQLSYLQEIAKKYNSNQEIFLKNEN